MSVTRETFSSEKYAEYVGASLPDGELNDSQREILYKDAVTRTLGMQLKEFSGSGRQRNAIEATLGNFTDAHDLLGVPEKVENQARALTTEGFQDFARELPEQFLDVPLDDFVNRYTSSLKKGNDGYFKYPAYREFETGFLKKRLRSSLKETGMLSNDNFTEPKTIRDLLEYSQAVENENNNQLIESTETDVGIGENVVRGLGSGSTDLIGKAIESISTLGNVIASKTGDIRFFGKDPATGERKIFSVYSAEEVKKALNESGSFSDDVIGNFGNSIQDLAKDIAEEADQDTIAFKGGQVAGQVAGFIGSQLLGGPAASLALAIGSGAEFQLDDYEQVLLEKGEKFNLNETENVALWGAAIGSLQSLPVFSTFSRLTGKNSAPKIMEWLNDLSGGAVVRTLKSGTIGAVEEGIQEAASQAAQNLVANKLVAYDEDRDLFIGTSEAGATGAAAGGVINALLGLVAGKRQVSRNVSDAMDLTSPITPDTPAPDTPTPNAPTPNAPTPEPFVGKTDGGRIVGFHNGRVAVGKNEESVLAELNEQSTEQNQPIDEENLIIDSVEDGDNTVYTMTVGDGKDVVTLIEPGILEEGGDDLQALVRSHNNETSNLVIPSGLVVTKGNDGDISASADGVNVTGNSVTNAVRELNKQLNNNVPSRPVKIQVEKITPSVDLPVNNKGQFVADKVEQNLVNSGFTIIPAGKANPITAGKVIAYKDGLVYTIQTSRSKAQGRGFKTTIRDLNGKKVNSPLTEASNQQVIDRKGTKVADGVQLAVPARGVEVTKQKVTGKEITQIVPESVERVARATGGRVVLNDPDAAAIQYGNELVSLLVQDGQLMALTGDGDVRQFSQGFNVLDPRKSKTATLSLLTNGLLSKGYSIQSQKANEVKLVNSQGKTVVLSGDGGAVTSTVVNEDGSTGSTERVADIINPELPIDNVQIEQDIRDQLVQEAVDNPRPKKTLNPNQKFQEGIEGFMDVNEDSFVLRNGKQVLDNSQGPSIILDNKGDDVRRTLHLFKTSTFAQTIDDGDLNRDGNEGRYKWEAAELDAIIDLLPAHIRRLINVHYEQDNPASQAGAHGYFDPVGSEGFGPQIHISAYNRTLESVISTLSEEVGHFSHDSWSVSSLTKMYDVLYDLVKNEAVAGLGPYIKLYNIDVNDPSPVHKEILINEFFSKQGGSIVDFIDGKIALPPGFTQGSFNTLKKEIENQFVTVQLDLTKDYTGDTTTANNFIADIMKIQAGGVISRSVVVDYKINLGDKKANLIVTTTPYGKKTQLIPDSQEASRLRRRRESINAGGVRGFLTKVWFEQFEAFVNTPLGRETTLLLAGAHQHLSGYYSQGLRRIDVKGSRIRAILETIGAPDIDFSESGYARTFVEQGIVNEKHIALAQEMDEFLQKAKHEGYKNVGLIHDEFRKSVAILREMALAHNVHPSILATWTAELRQQAERYSSDWDHRRYHSYTLEGRHDLNLILDELNGVEIAKGQDSLVIQAEKAQTEINALTDLDSVRTRLKIKELEKPIKLMGRIESLRLWAIEELRTSSPQVPTNQENIGNLMSSEVTEIIADFDQKTGFNTSDKLELINTVKGRTLDENDQHDRTYMDFLDPITDPLKIAVHNLEQQNKVINVLRFNNKLAVQMVSDGIARPLTSRLDTSYAATNDIGNFQTGSLLKYIEVDTFFARYIQSDIDTHNAIQSRALHEIVRFIKQGKTVLNPVVAAGNYVSNISILMMSGHIYYANRWGESRSEIRKAWTNSLEFTLSEDANIGDEIHKELMDNNVLSSGATAIGVELSSNDVIVKSIEWMTSTMEEASLMTNATKAEKDFAVFNAMEKLKRVYSFGDDWSKILPYLNNRAHGIMKAEVEVSRSDFQEGDIGDIDYNKAILNIAIPFAVSRTQRETNTWAITPGWIKKLARYADGLFFNTFIMHPAQMVKIEVENKIILWEDYKELSKARKEENAEYAALLRNRLTSRAIGNTIHLASAGTLMGGGTALTTGIVHSIIGMFIEEDDHKELKDRNYFTTEELEGTTEILNTKSYGGSALYYPVPFARNGFKFIAHNGKRFAASLTLVPPRPDSTDPELSDYVGRFLNNFLSIGDSKTIALQVVDIIRGEDRFGNKVSTGKQMELLTDILVPEIAMMPVEFMTGKQISGAKVERVFQLASLTGVRFKEFDARDTMADIAYRFRDFNSQKNNSSKKELLQFLKSGDELSQSEIIRAVRKNLSHNERLMSQVNYGINAHRKYGFSENLLIKHLQVKADNVTKTGMSATIARKLTQGVDVFSESMLRSVKSSREKNADKISQPSQNGKLTLVQLQNVDDALEIAEREYLRAVGNSE